MKDLYGLKESDVGKLKKAGYIKEDTYIGKDGKSVLDNSPLYFVTFNTSFERSEAYQKIFG